jgi:hypothetical protein
MLFVYEYRRMPASPLVISPLIGKPAEICSTKKYTFSKFVPPSPLLVNIASKQGEPVFIKSVSFSAEYRHKLLSA